MLDGCLVSIWITHLSSIISSLYKTSQKLSKIHNGLSAMCELANVLYEFLIGYFPYDDELFRLNNDILYIKPFAIKKDKNIVLDEDTAIIFLAYFEKLTLDKLANTFDKNKAKKYIVGIRNQEINIGYYKFLISDIEDNVPYEIASLFNQVLTLLNTIMSFNNKYNNWDQQMSFEISNEFFIYIQKLINATLATQREKKLYLKYIAHISHPPKFNNSFSLQNAMFLSKLKELKENVKNK